MLDVFFQRFEQHTALILVYFENRATKVMNAPVGTRLLKKPNDHISELVHPLLHLRPVQPKVMPRKIRIERKACCHRQEHSGVVGVIERIQPCCQLKRQIC
ncbi:hypothetical protein D3C84_1035790 [compost metagenome]